jgi:hypothetical protein
VFVTLHRPKRFDNPPGLAGVVDALSAAPVFFIYFILISLEILE